MKTPTLILTLCISLAATAQSQPQGGPPPPGQIGGNMGPLGNLLFPPDLVMRHQRTIKLSREQQDSIREEMRRTSSEFTDLQWQLSAEQEALASLVREPEPDPDAVQTQFDKLLALENQMKKLQLGMMIAIKNILTKDQQDKLRELTKDDRPDRPDRQDRPDRPQRGGPPRPPHDE